jgi:hypothetical protein
MPSQTAKTNTQNRRSAHTGSRPPQPPGRSAADPQDVYAQTMRRLRVYIGVLISILVASIARAVVDGLTTGLVLALALTAALLVAALGLWRIGSRRSPGGGPRARGNASR